MKGQKWRVRGAKLARLGLSIAVTMCARARDGIGGR